MTTKFLPVGSQGFRVRLSLHYTRKPRIRAGQRASKSTEWRTEVDSAMAKLDRNKDTSAMSISDFDRLEQALATRSLAR